MITLKALAALPVAAALAVLATPVAFADTTSVSSFDFTAEPGSLAITGSGHWAAPAQDVEIWENNNVVKVDATPDNGFHYIRVELTGPNGEPLHVGTYSNVGDPTRHPDQPGILAISQGLGCHADAGTITVDRVERDGAGALTAFDGSFDHHCAGPTSPTFHGEIHFQR